MEAAISRRPGRPARLSRESVLRAAVEVADEGGIEALTMQRVGEAVGAEAMSLYRHVRNKEDLIDGAVDLVFAEIELPPTDTDWRSAMRIRAVSVREVLRRHPWAVGLMESRAMPGPANMRHHDAVLGVLLGARVHERDRDARLQPRRQLRLRVRAPGAGHAVRQPRGAGGGGRIDVPGSGRELSRISRLSPRT